MVDDIYHPIVKPGKLQHLLFSNANNRWSRNLAQKLWFLTFLFASAAAFCNVVYLWRYGIFSGTITGNLVKLGVSISDDFRPGNWHEIMEDRDLEMANRISSDARHIPARNSLAAVLSCVAGAAVSEYVTTYRFYAGMLFAILSVLLESLSTSHYFSSFLDDSSIFPWGVVFTGITNGIQNHFTGRGCMCINTVALTGIGQSLPGIFMREVLRIQPQEFLDLERAEENDLRQSKKSGSLSFAQIGEKLLHTQSALRLNDFEKKELAHLYKPGYFREGHVVFVQFLMVPFGVLFGIFLAGFLFNVPAFAFSWWPTGIHLTALCAAYILHDHVLLQQSQGAIVTQQSIEAEVRISKNRASFFGNRQTGPNFYQGTTVVVPVDANDEEEEQADVALLNEPASSSTAAQKNTSINFNTRSDPRASVGFPGSLTESAGAAFGKSSSSESEKQNSGRGRAAREAAQADEIVDVEDDSTSPGASGEAGLTGAAATTSTGAAAEQMRAEDREDHTSSTTGNNVEVNGTNATTSTPGVDSSSLQQMNYYPEPREDAAIDFPEAEQETSALLHSWMRVDTKRKLS
ncbi:unnamed protein product [Amoebophrya sp. A120]|nr:unnamed protein product [Amoebophrya sp. A120]|eukprot:GSA120T00023429001.1